MSSKQSSVKTKGDVDFGVPFKQNNHTFIRCTYCGIGILIDKENGYVNAAKMVSEHALDPRKKNLTVYLHGDDWTELSAIYQEKMGKDISLVLPCTGKDGFSNFTKGTYTSKD
jgi:hypothetical protein